MSRVALVCLSLLVLGLSSGAAGAEKLPADKAKEKGPAYEGTIEQPGGGMVEKEFDLDKPEDAEALIDELRKGDVEHLFLKKDPPLLNLRWELGLWTIVVFLLLTLTLRKAAWGPMLEGLQKREQNIRSAIEDAQKARAEAQTMREQFQSEMAKANEKVRELMDAARRDAKAMTDDMLSKAKGEIQAERDRLRREIRMAQDQALKEIWSQSARVATVISAKAIRRHISEEDHRRLVDEALAELKIAATNGNRG